MQPKFPIGTKYKTRGKAPRLCTVTDILRTYNNANELVSIRYVSTHNSGNKDAAARELDITIERLNKILKGTDRGGY